MSALYTDELALEKLLYFQYDEHAPLADKIHHALKLGNEHFDTNCGIVSQVVDDDYIIKFCSIPDDSLEEGTHFNLGETYCVHTLQAQSPTHFHEAGKSEIASHPCFEKFQLETYIGSPIIIGGEVYGTVNFSSLEPRKKPFTIHDESFILSLGNWMGEEIKKGRIKD